MTIERQVSAGEILGDALCRHAAIGIGRLAQELGVEGGIDDVVRLGDQQWAIHGVRMCLRRRQHGVTHAARLTLHHYVDASGHGGKGASRRVHRVSVGDDDKPFAPGPHERLDVAFEQRTSGEGQQRLGP
jgi:hypothetical protein